MEEIASTDTLILENLNVTTTANLGAVGNVTITGGTNGQLLKTNGSGVLSWTSDTAPPAGSNTQVQYNNNGTIGANSTFTFNTTNNVLSAPNVSASSTVTATGNVTGGNLVTSGVIQATGNINGGNGVFTLGTVVSTNSNVSGNLNLGGASSSINFKAQDGANTAVIQAPAAIAGGLIGWNLPNTQGNVGEYLTVTATSEMEWKTVATTAPGANNSTGQTGQIAFDSGYIYVCVATNTWKRAAIATWP